MVLHPQNRVLPAQPLQLFSLLAGGKGIDYLVQIAVHDLFQIVDGQPDAMVGAAVLREVIGADLLTAVAGAHLPLTLGVDGILLFLLFLRSGESFILPISPLFELADSPSNLAPIPISCYNTGKEQPSDVRKSPIGFEPTLFIREPENSGRSWYAPLRGHQQ